MPRGAVLEPCIGEHAKVLLRARPEWGNAAGASAALYCGTSGSTASVPGRNNPSESGLLPTALLVSPLGQASPGGRACPGSPMAPEGQGAQPAPGPRVAGGEDTAILQTRPLCWWL